MANVFDNPFQPGRVDFDTASALGGQAYVQQPTRGELETSGFAGSLVAGFTAQATRGELTVTGFAGGLVTPISLNAQTGETTITGFYPGSQAKAGGLHDGATDADNDPISFEVVTQPAHGTLFVEFNGAFLYVPTRGFSGIDSFAWRPWAGGEAGNTVTVTFSVEPVRLGLTGELNLTGYAPAFAGSGLFSPADLGELTTTGFAGTLAAGFVGTALLGELDVIGFVPNLEGAFQAQLGELTVTGFAGVTVAGWINRATQGVALDLTGFGPTLVSGYTLQALLGELDLTGFPPSNIDLPHGFEAQATLGILTVTGFAPTKLISDLLALLGELTVTGFVPTLSFAYQPPDVSEPPPPIIYYDPRDHLPAGRILDRATYDALMEYWISVDRRILTDAEVQMIVGSPLPNPVIKRDWETALYPVRKVG